MRQLKKIEKQNIEDILSLTPMQEGMLFHYLKDPKSQHYFEQFNLGITGEIDIEVFKKAWNLVIETNDMLRAVFRWEKMEKPVQVILKEHKLPLEYYDFSTRDAGEKKKQLEEITAKDREKNFDLRKVPFRVTLCKIEADKYQVIISNHHILYDGWSNGIILKEFFEAYEALICREYIHLSRGHPKTKFKEFIKWQQNRDREKEERFWRSYFQGIDTQIGLSVKKSKRRNKTGSKNHRVKFDGNEKDKVEDFVKRHQLTLASFFYSAWGILLQKYNCCDDVMFGTTVSGRTAKIQGIEDIVGLFINTLPLRLQTSPGETIKDLLHWVDCVLRAREEFENSSLVDIKKYSAVYPGEELFDSIVILENYPLPLRMNNRFLAVDSYSLVEAAHYDLTVGIRAFAGLEISFIYNSSVFDDGCIVNLSRHFMKIIRQMVTTPLGDIPGIEIITREEKNRILYEFNNKGASYPRDKTIYEIFAEQAERIPDQAALVGQSAGRRAQSENEKHSALCTVCCAITYRELNEKSHQLACCLIEKGAGPDTIVGIMMERSIEMVIGIMGILKAGSAYLPIDPGYPEERMNYMLGDSGARVLLKKSEMRNPKFETNSNAPNSNYQNKRAEVTVLNFEDLNFRFVSNFEFSASNFVSSSLAYIIYTSGSTGNPKGVMVEHRPVVNLLAALQKVYPLGESDAYLLKTSYSFDVSVTELFGWFWQGGKLVVLEAEGEKEPEKIIDTIERSGVTHINFVPSMFNVFVEELLPGDILKLSCLKYIFLAGEVVLSRVIDKFRHLNTAIVLENIYGPTEGTVYSSKYSLSYWDGFESIPIGKPLANIQLYILNKNHHLQPIGIPGELVISGIGLCRGYLNNPVLTNQKLLWGVQGGGFLEKSPPGRRRQRFYKTGDLAHWLPDGNIEFLGRIDQQVKIRGFRIELGEIESQLVKHERIRDVAVVASEDADGEKYLCAYLVFKDREQGTALARTPGTRELIDYLFAVLPGYMIPAYFVPVAAIPLTSGGKVDRKALPPPVITGEKEIPGPRDPIENKLLEIWQEVLGLKHSIIGIDDNFFQLGGHSLKAAALVSYIHKELKVKVPLDRIFQERTVRRLAAYIRKIAKADIYTAVRPTEKKEYYPLASAQKRLLFLDQFDHIGTTYNMPVILKIEGAPDKERFESALRALIERHEILRTSFTLVNNQPVQRVHHHMDFHMEEIEMGSRDIHTVVESFVHPFDLKNPPLLRAVMVRLSDNQHFLLFDMHHITSDGTSTSVLVEEFTRGYKGESLPLLNLQYRDFSQWQNQLIQEGKIREQEVFWRNLYSDDVPKLNLPADYPRPAGFTFQGDRWRFCPGSQETGKLREISKEKGVTFFMSLLTAFNILLYKYTGEEDIIVGTVVAGRSHPDLYRNIGMFVNTLALRNHPAGQKTCSEFLNEVKHTSIKAFENQDLQFEALVDRLKVYRDASRNPLFDVCLVVQNIDQKTIDVQGLTFSRYDYVNKISQFDMALDVREQGEDIVCDLEYYTALFKKETIQCFAGHFLNIIRQVCKNPDMLISEIDMLSPEEKYLLTAEFNQSNAGYPLDKTIHHLIREQAERTPDTLAVVFEDAYITYGQLEEKAGQLAHYIYNSKGIRPGHRVGVMMEKSLEGVIAILGILEAGAAYLPIDPLLPLERSLQVLKDAGIEVVISQQRFLGKLNHLQWESEKLHTYICMDTRSIHTRDEMDEDKLAQMEKLWNYIGETAADDIGGGGWVSSYTSEPFSRAEMDEYGDNVLKKLLPLLHQNMRVLEIGCASGITMFRIAPRVGFYYGTDLAAAIIRENEKYIHTHAYHNIKLSVLPAHEIDQAGEKDFDLVIINSVVQDFYGHNYLQKVIYKALSLMRTKGYFFFGDIMDLDLKAELVREMTTFKQAHKNKKYKTKIDFSRDFFVSREFFSDLSIEIPAIQGVEFSEKIHTIENELTRFRYDVLITIDQSKSAGNKVIKKVKSRYQEDLTALASHPGQGVNPGVRSSDPAYIMFTSGSTAKPKGVMVEHRNVVNLVQWFAHAYNLHPGVHLLQLTGYEFDPSVEDMFAVLHKGATLYVGNRQLGIDREKFCQFVNCHDIHMVDFIPSALIQLLGEGKRLAGLRIVISGGERLEESIKNQLIEKGYQLYNHYGPTEITVDALWSRCSREKVNLGGPIANTRCYVLDKDHHPAPIGVKGELCIAGAGVSRGYLNDPELTHTRFSTTGVMGQRLYRTGDACRWLMEGKIEFLDRIDDQVKIRGYRIEPGEIENQIRQIMDIDLEEVVVIDREDNQGEKYLCAYFFAEEHIDVSELKGVLSGRLPDYMVPLYFTQLEKIPRKSNGKIDRLRLPAPGPGPDEQDYVGPRDEIERKLTRIWADVLNINVKGIDDNFFELGGHSLKATMLVSQVHKVFHLKLPLAEVFKTPTIRELAQYIKRAAKSKYAAVQPAEKKNYYPLSSAQKRLYFLQELDLNSTTYNMPLVINMDWDIDKNKIESLLKRLIRRHESLRTSFEMVKGGLAQRIHDQVEFKIEYNRSSVNGKCFEGTRGLAPLPKEPATALINSFIRPFDLSKALLLRVGLIELPHTPAALRGRSSQKGKMRKYLFMFDMHHIISDGISMNLFIKEFMALYHGESLPVLALQYKDFSQWQNNRLASGKIKGQQEYWLQQFDDDFPVLNLTYDYPRPLVQSFAGSTLNFEIGENETAALNALALKQNTTLYMLILSCLNVLLAKLSGQEDIIVGTPIAGRRHADLQEIIGMFVNTLALRNFPQAEKSFKGFLLEVKAMTLQAFENQDYQFEDLVEKIKLNRDASRNPLFDVMFVFQDREPVSTIITDLKIKSYEFETRISKFDLTFHALETGKSLFFKIEYCTKLFKKETIERFGGYFRRIASAVVENPDAKITDIEILSEDETKLLLDAFNESDARYPQNKTLQDLFAEQVEKTPDNMAVVGPPQMKYRSYMSYTTYISYKKLNEKSNQLAYFLQEKGAGPDTIVGIMMERSIEMIVGIMAILKTGAAYLPIDPEYPEERRNYMLKDSNARIIIKKSEIRNPKSETNPNDPNSNDQNKRAGDTVLDFEHLNFEFVSGFEFRASNLSSSSLAYIIYTSGTTGRPKGVMIDHRNVVRLMINDQFQFDFNERDAWTMFHSYCFDFSVWEMYGALLYGGKLVVIPKINAMDPQQFLEVLKKEKVTILNQTPAAFYNLVFQESKYSANGLNLRYVIFGGDVLTPGKLKKWKERYPGIKMINMFGITETTVHVTFKEMKARDIRSNISNIGKPIPTLNTYLMDKNLKLVPFGVPGELCVGGAGVGRGYLNRPELNREKFVQNPYKPGERLYKSGDLVRLTSDKEMEYLGRIDYQVKIRGFRIELGEIETQLLNHPLVKEVVVILIVDDSGDKQLCAYIVCLEAPNTTELKEFLAKKLPDYMIPSYMVILDKIPLTPNGKVDKKALPGPKAAAKETYTAPRNVVEKRLVEIWSEVLGVEYPLIGINSNFFELGGHSLKATVLLGRVHQEFNIKIPLGEFFKNPTIKELAHYGQSSVKNEYVALGRMEKREFYALSASQKHMFILSQFIEYNMPTAMVIEGKLDRELFESVLQKMVKRHESLRTSFEIIEGEPVQRIYDEVDFEIECDEVPRPQGTLLSIRGAPQGMGVLTSIIENFFRPFDLSQPPLIRVGLIKLPGDFTDLEKYLLLVNIHHVVSDGITIGILAREFMSLYEGKTLPELKIQYKDFSQWEQEFFKTEVFKEQEKYWLNEFTGEIPVLNMPTDFPRPVKQSFAGGRVSFGIEGETFQALKTLATKQAASLYMFFMTVYNTVLFRYTGQEDIIVGTITAGREKVDVKDLAGIFINTLAARNYPGENKTFNKFLKEVKTIILNAFRNQRYPFGELLDRVDVKKNLSRTPLFDVMMIWQNMDIPELEVKGLRFFPFEFETVQIEQLVHAQHDMTLWVIQGESALRFDLEYCTKLFKKETMERFARHFLNLLKEIVKDPETRLGDIDMMGEEEKKQVLVDFNNTDDAFPVVGTMVELFEKLVERIPDNIAAVGPGQVKNRTYMTYMTYLSYKELNDKSNQLAHVLQEKGVQPDTIVGMMMERCVEMFIGILAILKAGGAYLPLDPGYPQKRIDFMLNDSNARIILKKSEIRNPKFETNPNDSNSNDQNKRAEVTVLNFEDLNFRFVSNFEFRASNFVSSNLAYVIYTSGSTGRPKGVMVNHGNFVNAAFAWRKEYRLDEIRVNLLQVAGFSFDVFAGDFARVFINGGKLVICPEDTRMDPPSLHTLIRQQHITLFESTPSLVIPFMEYVYEHQLKIDNLQLLIAGSDSCPVDDFKKLIFRFGHQMRIINSYGVTEATIDTSYYEKWINDIPSSGNVPIGKPMPNMKFFVLDPHENLQPVGIPGELSIGGEGVTRGYLNNPELTAERFLSVSHRSYRSYRSYISKKIYKTGDLARWLPDGNMEFLGRMDSQVKVRGYRIELKEIENQLKKYRGIKETVVLAPGGNLCACIVFSGEGVPVSEIREYLSGELPDYMIPTHFIEVKQIPLTPNGKIDKKALYELDRTIGIGTEYVAPTNEVEKKLAGMWSEILEKDRVGIDDNFFDLGGQSLIAMRLISMIKEVFNVKVQLTAFFQMSTVKAIAGLILETQSRESQGKEAVEEDHSFASVKFEMKKRREREI